LQIRSCGKYSTKKTEHRQESQARYSGESALTKSGSVDFGEISPEIAKAIKRQAGKIQLRIGKQVNGEKDNYGEAHINRESRKNQLNDIGYADARAIPRQLR